MGDKGSQRVSGHARAGVTFLPLISPLWFLAHSLTAGPRSNGTEEVSELGKLLASLLRSLAASYYWGASGF